MPDDPTVAERAVVVQLLDRKRAATRSELYAAIREDVTPTDIDAAIVGLTERGVVHEATDGGLCPTATLEHLDRLGLICV
jgi:hypothetical protein